MNSMSQVYLTLMLLLASSFSMAKVPINCITLSEDYAGMSALIDGGDYRYIKPEGSKQVTSFSYQPNISYSEYLNYAMKDRKSVV